MIVLGIESSCDETAAAVLTDGRRIVSSVVASQDAIHAPYGGVVPELASRRHLEVITPVIAQALRDAGVTLADLDGIAVTQGPGLVGSLLIGCSVAKSLAWVHKKPLVGVNHLEGHIYASFLTEDPPEHPFLALVVSGGHTALYHAKRPREYGLVGQTRDDAAGEAFDKVAKLLGLGFPGGPIIQKTAERGDPRSIAFPLAHITDGAHDFSFSGIKTSVSLYVKGHRPLSEAQVADVAASFQAAVVKMLVRRTLRAALRPAGSGPRLEGDPAHGLVARSTAHRDAGHGRASLRGGRRARYRRQPHRAGEHRDRATLRPGRHRGSRRRRRARRLADSPARGRSAARRDAGCCRTHGRRRRPRDPESPRRHSRGSPAPRARAGRRDRKSVV